MDTREAVSIENRSTRYGSQDIKGLGELNEISDVAVYLHCGRTHIFALLKSGELRSVKIGRKRLITADDVREYVRKVSESQ